MGFRLLLAAPVIGMLLPAAPAGAHDWYPLECCSNRDCHPAEPGEIKVEAEGLRIVPTDELIPWSEVRPSPDGRMHRCSSGGKPEGRTICIFAGAAS